MSIDNVASHKRSNGKAAENSLRALPAVDKVMMHPAMDAVRAQLPNTLVAEAARDEVEAVRESLRKDSGTPPGLDAIAERAAERALKMVSPSLRPVINATGVIIHTNLGRAPLSQDALQAMNATARYSNLEYDLEAGQRGSRYTHAADILRRVTGCEDALVVNNNASALLLSLSALAAGKQVVLSRGQSVEIGGGFRIPDVMSQSGAQLIEVGTTNRTYISDYANAITDETALIMRVHTSNFRVTGFVTSPDVSELAQLAHERDILMIDDVGSGALIDTTRYGLASEPMVQSSIESGADLVLFSGDKLLGGPQCGVIAGKQSVVSILRKHPLARALRVDKITLAGLEATLLHYLKGEVESKVPVWRMIATTEAELKKKAQKWAAQLTKAGVKAHIERGESTIGGGSLPGETLPTWLVSIIPNEEGGEQEAGSLAYRLRHAATPIIARVEHGALLLDPITVLEGEEQTLLKEILNHKF